jgi:hypothetical protein
MHNDSVLIDNEKLADLSQNKTQMMPFIKSLEPKSSSDFSIQKAQIELS